MMYWCAILSVLLAVESVMAGTCFAILFPSKPSALALNFFTTYQHAEAPKRDVFLFRLFLVVAVAAFFVLMRYCSRLTAEKKVFVQYCTSVQAFIVIAQTFFLFKYALYHYPVWLNGFYASLAASVGIKIFIPEIYKVLRAFNERLKDNTPVPKLSFWLTAAAAVLVPLIIWAPDAEGVTARMFFGEHWHHIDGALMSPGWAYLSGNVLGIDNTSRYGIGAPVLIAELARRVLGRFDYVNVVIITMMVCIAYYWTWFYALRLVLKDAAWAVIALFLGLRLQFFNVETFPCIFTYPQASPVRFFFDSLFFLFLVLHTQTGRMVWLYLSAAVCGFAVFYITAEGAYALAAFYIFLLLREVFAATNPNAHLPRLPARQIVQLLLIPWVVLLGSFWTVEGGHIFTAAFWVNQFDFINILGAGNIVSPMIDNLTPPFILQASLAFVFPVVYLFGLVLLLGRLMRKTLTVDGLLMTAAVIFLLISYHYTVMVSRNMPSYLRNGVVIAMVATYVLKEITAKWGTHRQRLCKLACGLLVLLVTVTTHQFLLHPNIFNLSRNPMTHPVVSQVPVGRNSYFSHLFISYPDAFKLPVNGLGQKDEMLVTENDFSNDKELKDLYRKETDYGKDASLIRSLTSPGQQVPVVSSFENLILMQADRRPFFYLYFMVNSQPRRMRKFPVTMLYTKENLQREISRIDNLQPPFIFVEKTYLVSPIPRAYLYDNEDLVSLLSYIFGHYEPYRAGEFLEAMKRK